MFDTSFHFKGKQLSGSEIYEDGLKLADTWLARKKDAEMANIKRQTQDITDPDNRFAKMIGLAKQSKRSPWLIADLEAEKSAAEKAGVEMDAKLANTAKVKADTGHLTHDLMVKRYNTAGQVWNAAYHGGPAQAKVLAANQYKAGLMTDDEYKSTIDTLDGLESSGYTLKEQQDFAMNMFRSMQDPKYTLVDANTQANNETSQANNIRTTQATMRGQDLDYEGKIKAAEIGFQGTKYTADSATERKQLEIKADKEKFTIFDANGLKWKQYNDGSIDPVIDPTTNQQLKAQSAMPKPESLADKMERQKKVLNLEHSAEQTRQGIHTVGKIRTLLDSMGKGNGWIDNGVFWAESKIGGTDAYTLMKHIETLKSNVFLSQLPQMKGMGALTDAEGARLENAIASLDPYSKDFPEALKEIETIFNNIEQRTRQEQMIYSSPEFDEAFYH